MSDPSFERAQAIKGHLTESFVAVGRANGALREALLQAGDDYELNDYQLRNILGAMNLLSVALVSELNTWETRTLARKEALPQNL